MQFTCNRDAILREIIVANEIIYSRNTLSTLSAVLLHADEDKLTIRATDIKVSFETHIPIVSETPGKAAVFCGKFLSILRSLPGGDVFISKEGERVRITDRGNIEFQLYSISVDNFPEIPDCEESLYFSLAQKDLVYMIKQTIFAISADETRYFMSGIYMNPQEDKLVMVATDGRRLSHVYSVPGENLPDFPGIIIPPKVLNLVVKLATGEGAVKLAVVDRLLFIRFDKQKLTSTLIDGQFPNYSRVIPEDQKFNFTVKRSEFNDAIRRVSLLSDQKTKRVFLLLSRGNVVLKSDEREIGKAEERIKCVYDGPKVVFSVNHSYLTDPLNVIEEEDIALRFTDPFKAITIDSPDGATFFHIVMPMQKE